MHVTSTIDRVLDGGDYMYAVGANGRLFLRTNDGNEARRALDNLLMREAGTAWIETPFSREEVTERRERDRRKVAVG